MSALVGDRRLPKPPPENPEAEASLLGAMLIDSLVYTDVVRGRIAPADLSRENHRAVLRAILNMMGAEQIAHMRDGSYLINLSRGTVVDVEALASAVRSKKLAGAALDVYPDEPESNSDDFTSVVRGLPNVILTPHIGGSTPQAP